MGITLPLKRFIEMANAGSIDLGLCHAKFLLGLPKIEVVGRAERLRDTILHVKDSPFATLGNYYRARQARAVLLRIASTGEFVKRRIDGRKRGAVYLSRIGSPANSEQGRLHFLRTELPIIRTRYYADVASDGRIALSEEKAGDTQFFEEFARALNNVDATAIRRCGPCGRLFWAGRRDKAYCSNNCRQRCWRQENPAEVAEIQSRYDAQRERLRPASETGERPTRRRAEPEIGQGKRHRAPRLPGSTP